MRQTLKAKLVFWALVGGCVVVVYLLLGVVWMWMCRDQPGWRVGELERLILEEVPPGCTREQAEAWFDKHGIKHGYTADMTGVRYGNSTLPMLAGLRDEDLSGMACALLEGPEANVGCGLVGRIHVSFFFDKEGRCVGHLIYPFVYNL